jgi:uncharacterized phage protein (TIGR01671 family)
MREIKFRAWDKNHKKMVDNVGIYYADETLHRVFDSQNGIIYSAIPMQFTGLHDSQGREIYEGDIVSRTENSPCCGKLRFSITGVVKWHGEGFYLYEDDGTFWGWANKEYESMEVIGNIYENRNSLAHLQVGELHESISRTRLKMHGV